jgi:hypothetical protein
VPITLKARGSAVAASFWLANSASTTFPVRDDEVTLPVCGSPAGDHIQVCAGTTGQILDAVVGRQDHRRAGSSETTLHSDQALIMMGAEMQDEPAGPGRDPFDGETPEESELFAQALSAAVAAAVADHFSKQEAERHIRQRQKEIWQCVVRQRHRARQAVIPVSAAERQAESAVRQDEPRLACLCDEARQHEERMLERGRRFHTTAEQVREVCIRGPRLAPTEAEAQWIEDLVAEMERETREHAAWLEQIRRKRLPTSAAPAATADAAAPNDKPPSTGGRSWFRHRKPPTDLDIGALYEKVLDTLVKFRRMVAEVSTERKKADWILWSEVDRRCRYHDPGFQPAKREMEAAWDDLLTSLVHEAMLPEIRSFMAQQTGLNRSS